jgi:hypothetical protein
MLDAPIKRRLAIPLSQFAPLVPLGGKSEFFGAELIRTTIAEQLRSPGKFLTPRVLHPQFSIIYAPKCSRV